MVALLARSPLVTQPQSLLVQPALRVLPALQSASLSLLALELPTVLQPAPIPHPLSRTQEPCASLPHLALPRQFVLLLRAVTAFLAQARLVVPPQPLLVLPLSMASVPQVAHLPPSVQLVYLARASLDNRLPLAVTRPNLPSLHLPTVHLATLPDRPLLQSVVPLSLATVFLEPPAPVVLLPRPQSQLLPTDSALPAAHPLQLSVLPRSLALQALVSTLPHLPPPPRLVANAHLLDRPPLPCAVPLPPVTPPALQALVVSRHQQLVSRHSAVLSATPSVLVLPQPAARLLELYPAVRTSPLLNPLSAASVVQPLSVLNQQLVQMVLPLVQPLAHRLLVPE